MTFMTAEQTQELRANPEQAGDILPAEAKRQRGRPRQAWQPLEHGYELHPNGYVRDHRRHRVTNPLLLEWLLGDQHPQVTCFYRLACCGLPWSTDDPHGARRHEIDCLEAMMGANPNCKPGQVSSMRSAGSGKFIRHVDGNPRIPFASGYVTGDLLVVLDHSQPDPFRTLRGDSHIH